MRIKSFEKKIKSYLIWFLGFFFLLISFLLLAPHDWVTVYANYNVAVIGHIFSMLILSFLLGLVFIVYFNWRAATFWVVFFVGLAFSIVTEWLQDYLPFFRGGSIQDIYYNLIGVTLGLLLLGLYLIIKKKQEEERVAELLDLEVLANNFKNKRRENKD